MLDRAARLTLVHAFDLGNHLGHARLVFDGARMLSSEFRALELEQPGDADRRAALAYFRDYLREEFSADAGNGWERVAVWEHAQGANPLYVAQHGELRAVLMLATLQRHPLDIASIPVGTWKKAVTGKGNATKDQVRSALMARRELRDLFLVEPLLTSQDCVDAFGIGLAWASKHLGWR